METKKLSNVYFNDNTFSDLRLYDIKSISELKNEELFGVLLRPCDIHVVYPSVNFDENGEWDFDLDVSYKSFDANFESYTRIPLVFQKLEGNLVQELLTGQIFRFCDTYGYLEGAVNAYVKKAGKNQALLDFRNIHMILDSNVCEDDWTYHNAAFEINDAFKAVYSKYTMQRKADVIEYLNGLYEQANDIFETGLEHYVSAVQDIAMVEDYFHSLEKK